MGAATGPPVVTLAQRFRDAVWEADANQLSTTEAMILLAYADHARGTDTAWVAQSRLMQRCKVRSKDTPSRVLAGLVEKGWLELLSPAQWRNKQSPTYRLRIPTAPISGEVNRPDQQGGHGTQPPRSEGEPPRSLGKAPRSVAQSSPMSGAKLPDDRVPLSSERPSGLSGGEDSSRTASPHDEPTQEQQPADADGPPMAAEDARQHMRLLLADKGRIRLSRWSRHREAEPNPAYDPAVTVAQVAEMAAMFDAARDETPPERGRDSDG